MTTFSPSSGKGRCSALRPPKGARWDENLRASPAEQRASNATGEVIKNDGVWKVYEFTWLMDAILLWARSEGHWRRRTEFHYPEPPENLRALKPLANWPKSDPRDLR
ncbi:hypothetical protein [Bradyrhizobium sp. 144]|uniref:hypothetical protein n=1 Tax=Bradyrhizobium sp. 144 TaxID=2782620 RepID=UPI001FF90469|nr:hypothetical protein [Bradyrhizobium sp. 144]MCK1692468.1 hypothetical protein [Bradyrhizobium sp. 144]